MIPYLLPAGLVLLLCGATAAMLAALAWRAQSTAQRARRWPRVQGQVIAASVQERQVRQRISTSTGRYRMATRYSARITYAYLVGGRRYTAERLRLGPVLLSSDTRAAEREIARYPIGSSVIVSYDPSNPSDATLETNVGWGTRLLWIAAASLLLLGVIAAAVIVN